MKKINNWFFLTVLSAVSWGGASGGNAAEKGVSINETDLKWRGNSNFSNDINFGCDPFFPTSQRRKPIKMVTAGTSTAIKKKQLSSYLRLVGISGFSSRRLALINKYTFEVGEAYKVSTPEGSVLVKCLEIRDDSVVVQVEGEAGVKELKLSEGF